MTSRTVLIICVMCLLLAGVCQAAIVIPGADGSDGVFNPTSNVEIDLGLAANAAWDTASPVAGKGVYDAEKWAVVFKYSEVNIPAGVTVTFKNHSPNAPVVWLVSGNVTISGTVNLNGQEGIDGYSVIRNAGPGGFRGGAGDGAARAFMTGLGPGGGEGFSDSWGGWGYSGTYSTLGSSPSTAYGNAQILPLIGGSGAAGGANSSSGSGGGGAILIACSQTLSVSGSLMANGGSAAFRSGSGSGGAVRIVADTYQIGGIITATAGYPGRIRIEAVHGSATGHINPEPSYGAPASPAQIWPEPAAPSLKVTQVAGLSVTSDPAAGLDFPNQDVKISAQQTVTIRVEAANVPLDWLVKVRVSPLYGTASWIDATRVSGDASASVWEVQITPPSGFCALQARASKP